MAPPDRINCLNCKRWHTRDKGCPKPCHNCGHLHGKTCRRSCWNCYQRHDGDCPVPPNKGPPSHVQQTFELEGGWLYKCDTEAGQFVRISISGATLRALPKSSTTPSTGRICSGRRDRSRSPIRERSGPLRETRTTVVYEYSQPSQLDKRIERSPLRRLHVPLPSALGAKDREIAELRRRMVAHEAQSKPWVQPTRNTTTLPPSFVTKSAKIEDKMELDQLLGGKLKHDDSCIYQAKAKSEPRKEFPNLPTNVPEGSAHTLEEARAAADGFRQLGGEWILFLGDFAPCSLTAHVASAAQSNDNQSPSTPLDSMAGFGRRR